jgi:hypothetical protein
LIAAFHATLEEIAEADLLLHMVDISHPNALGQYQAVLKHWKRSARVISHDHRLEQGRPIERSGKCGAFWKTSPSLLPSLH